VQRSLGAGGQAGSRTTADWGSVALRCVRRFTELRRRGNAGDCRNSEEKSGRVFTGIWAICGPSTLSMKDIQHQPEHIANPLSIADYETLRGRLHRQPDCAFRIDSFLCGGIGNHETIRP